MIDVHIALLIFKSRQGAHADIASATPDNRNMVNVDFYGNENVSRENVREKRKGGERYSAYRGTVLLHGKVAKRNKNGKANVSRETLTYNLLATGLKCLRKRFLH